MIRETVEHLGAHRLLFASDGPGCDPALEVEKVRRAGLTPEQEAMIFKGNIARILSGVKH
jgi:predicted TIM-barrel fold metal-dependent hydrolase